MARRRGECNLFGAAFDIAADRVIENVLWIALADLGRVPFWNPALLVIRGVLVDSARAVAVADGHEPFELAFGQWGRAIVAGRGMRGLYGSVKLVAFCWFLLAPSADVWTDVLDETHAEFLVIIGIALYTTAAALCLIRGLPVLMEAFRCYLGVGLRQTFMSRALTNDGDRGKVRSSEGQ